MSAHSLVLIFLWGALTHSLWGTEVPPGYRLQELKPLGGEILIPESWHYKGGMTSTGFMFVLSKEKNEDGSYETGFRIQGVIDITKKGYTPIEACRYNIEKFKQAAKEIIKECDEEHVGIFKKTCLETIQENPKNPDEDFRIVYSFFWNNEIDMMVVGIFGTPESKWEEGKIIYSKMKNFILLDAKKIEEESKKKKKTAEINEHSKIQKQ